MDVESAICLPIYLLMLMILCYLPHRGMLCKVLISTVEKYCVTTGSHL